MFSASYISYGKSRGNWVYQKLCQFHLIKLAYPIDPRYSQQASCDN